MPNNNVELSHSELAALDMLINKLQEDGVGIDDTVAFTPMAAAAGAMALATAGGLCQTTNIDPNAIQQLEEAAKNLGGQTTLRKLLEARNEAVKKI